MGGVLLLNILILKDRVSRKSFFNWKKYGVSKLTATNDILKNCFKNLDDLDFVISDTETLLKEDAKLFKQLSEYGLNNRLIVYGPVEKNDELMYLLRNGVKSYQSCFDDFEQIIVGLFDERIAEKKRESFFLAQLYDGSIVKKVRHALEKGDSRLIQKIISGGSKLLPMPMFQIKEYYLLILKTVFEFAEEKGVRHIEKKEVISELIDQTDFESVKECTYKKVNSLIHLVEVNKNNQNKMVAEYIKDFIDDNYMKQDTNAGNIADRFGVSGSYIGMLFKEQFKTTITKYITQLRIKKAADLLSETKLQIQVISKKVGYSDQNYFARIFKKHMGLSPGEYRNKCSH